MEFIYTIFPRGPYWKVGIRGFVYALVISGLSIAAFYMAGVQFVPKFRGDGWIAFIAYMVAFAAYLGASATIELEAKNRMDEVCDDFFKQMFFFLRGVLWLIASCVVFYILLLNLSVYFGSVLTALPPLLIQGIASTVMLALAVMIWCIRIPMLNRRLAKASGTRTSRNRDVGVRGAVLGLDHFFAAMRRMLAFTNFIGFRLLVGIACGVGLYYLWHWTPTFITPGPGKNMSLAIAIIIWSFWPVHLVAYAVLLWLIVGAIKDLWWLLVGLLGHKPLEDEQAHGPAAEATEQQAALHERGDARLPIHQQRFE